MRVFFCEETSRVAYALRVYESGPCPQRSGEHSYHEARSEKLGEFERPPGEYESERSPEDFADDGRWPSACACGHVFGSAAQRQVFTDRILRRPDTGDEFEGRRAIPPGGVWNAWWMADRPGAEWTGADGRSLVCRLPDGRDWMIDSRASNCTRPDDSVHKCWVRHGRPEDGTLHVDKNGETCAAGAGSIQTPAWHGFLHNGELRGC